MALFAQPNYVEIAYTADEKGIPQLTTCRVNVTELSPRSFNINLLKKPSADRERLVKLFQHYSDTKQPVMVNGKEGETDSGIVYFQMSDSQIMPVSTDFAAQQQALLDSLSASVSKVVEIPDENLPDFDKPTILGQSTSASVEKKKSSFGQ